MTPLQQEIARLLAKEPMMAGQIRNKLNGPPMLLDISQEDVLSELRRLEAQLVVECLWRIKETPIQT